MDAERGLVAARLHSEIDQTGYYPGVVKAGVASAVADEEILDFLVHHEPTIDRDEVRRHITVVVLTATRLILAHTDEHPPDDLLPEPYTSTSTEAISLERVSSVVITRLVGNSASFTGCFTRGDQASAEAPREAVLTISWGGVQRVDLEPARCGDATCDADHGYTGVLAGDDFSLRMSAAADGQGAVDRLLAFATSLSTRTHT